MAAHKAKYPSPLAQPWRVRACAPTQPVASSPCASFPFSLEDSRSFAFIRGSIGFVCAHLRESAANFGLGLAEVLP